jgi:adenylyltransferase/sulfurtransferase
MRYSRQIALPEIGVEGQRRLGTASILVIGAGGLGSPAATYLAAAGVGRIGLLDFDRVDESNLHRQVLFTTHDIGRLKVDAGVERLRAMNPEVEVIPHATRLTAENAFDLLQPYDIIVDGTDNFATRYLVNDACVLLGKPNIYGSVLRFEGQASVFATANGPCYRCLHPEPPPSHLIPSCAEAGVLGVLPGIIGTIQATEAIKWVTGTGVSLAGRLLLFDASAMTTRVIQLRRRCGEHARIKTLIDYEELCHPVNETDITPAQLAEKLSRKEAVVLIDVREPHEWSAGHLEAAQHIPLRQLPDRLTEIPKDQDVVMICRSGARSEHARAHLANLGYTRIRNLSGGLQRWSREIDPSLRVV